MLVTPILVRNKDAKKVAPSLLNPISRKKEAGASPGLTINHPISITTTLMRIRGVEGDRLGG